MRKLAIALIVAGLLVMATAVPVLADGSRGDGKMNWSHGANENRGNGPGGWCHNFGSGC